MPAYSGDPFWQCTLEYGPFRKRAALLRDDGPIGSNTLIEWKESPSRFEPVKLLWPDTYDGRSPLVFRIRFVLYGVAGLTVPHPGDWENYDRYRYERWLVIVSTCEWTTYGCLPEDRLPNYDPNDGTSHPYNMFDVPPGCVWTAAGARMMRCDGTQIIKRFPPYESVLGGSTDKQHPCPTATSYENPALQDTMWEFEYAEYRPPGTPMTQWWPDGLFYTWREGRVIQPLLEWYGRNKFTGEWEGPFYQGFHNNYMLVDVYFRRPVVTEPPPSSLAIHAIDKSHLAFASLYQIKDRNLFSDAVIAQWPYFPETYSVTRVRYLPRYGTVLALGNYGTSYSLRLGELGTNNHTEVLSVTATSATIEIAEDQRIALLVYSSSDNYVYRQISHDGGWTWSSPEQCVHIAGGRVEARAVYDLDYSPRRRCWFLVAQTGTSRCDVFVSEDGLRWQLGYL